MKQILDAILSGSATAEDFAALAIPDSYRAVTVHKDEEQMFEGLTTRDKDPRKSLHVEDVPAARARPGRGARRRDGQLGQLQHRVDVDLRARLDLRLPRALRPDQPAGQAARPALPRGRVRPLRRRAAHRPGRAHVEARATRSSRTACRSSSRARSGTTTRCSTRSSASGASRPTSAASRRSRSSRPTSCCTSPSHLTWEEAAVPGLVNSTAYRQLVSRNGAGMKQGDLVLIWGASRRARLLRHADGAQRRRHPGLRRLVAGEGRDLPADGRGADHRPQRRTATRSGRTSTPRTRRSGGASAPTSARSPAATTSTSCSSTRAARRSARRSTSRARAARSSRARRRRATCTSTTTASSG